MSTDVAARRRGGRFHTRLMAALAAALLTAAVVPLVGAQATGRHHHGWGHHHSSGDGKLLFFTSDGMRQDQIAKYADQGLLPGFRDMLRHGAFASRNGLLTQAPPNTGAGWFTLSDRRVAGRPRLDQQHLPHQRLDVRQLARRRSRPADHSPGRDARPVG